MKRENNMVQPIFDTNITFEEFSKKNIFKEVNLASIYFATGSIYSLIKEVLEKLLQKDKNRYINGVITLNLIETIAIYIENGKYRNELYDLKINPKITISKLDKDLFILPILFNKQEGIFHIFKTLIKEKNIIEFQNNFDLYIEDILKAMRITAPKEMELFPKNKISELDNDFFDETQYDRFRLVSTKKGYSLYRMISPIEKREKTYKLIEFSYKYTVKIKNIDSNFIYIKQEGSNFYAISIEDFDNEKEIHNTVMKRLSFCQNLSAERKETLINYFKFTAAKKYKDQFEKLNENNKTLIEYSKLKNIELTEEEKEFAKFVVFGCTDNKYRIFRLYCNFIKEIKDILIDIDIELSDLDS